ncbi:MAG: peptidase M64 [Ignavibacterium sp.]|nr:MAG: peptidase M64 [Ignavibacterium sp.]
MRILLLSIITSLCFIISISSQEFETFDTYFVDKTMRIDYFHIGDAKSELVTVDQIYRYGIWPGSRIKLISNFNYGRYFVKIFDAVSGELIYSKGFDSYFGEYKTSQPAIDGVKKTFHESAIIPSPKYKIFFTLHMRDKKNQLSEIFRAEIDPDDVNIRNDDLTDPAIKVFESDKNGDPHSRVDVAIISEGYTNLETEKFLKDLAYFTDVFFIPEPYKSRENNFNIYGVFKASAESGVDEPRANIFKNTVLNCTFNSMGSERYLLTEDNKTLRDIAANVPYDAVFIMVNQSRYGGGGIYNFYCTFTADNQWKDYVFLHEFGHSFVGLADEYYTSSTAYNEFYPKGVEPAEANITALLDPSNLKWDNLKSPGIEMPTPWEKADYDAMDMKWQSERAELNDNIAQLKRNKASQQEITKAEQQYDLKDKIHAEEVDAYLENSRFVGQVGAFEGAGYSSQGLYRPMLDCIMFTKGNKPFCKVCEKAAEEMIDSYMEY